MRLLKKVVAWLRGGTAGLNESEAALISCVLDELPVEEAQKIREQVELINLVQRPQPGRMMIMFHRKPLPLLENRDDEICLAEVTFTGSKGRKRKVKLMLHSGFLQSIEGSFDVAVDGLRSSAVSLWPGKNSRTPEAIDRLEHGSKGDSSQSPPSAGLSTPTDVPTRSEAQ